jgi:signal transduction histidine kinase
MDMEAQAFVLVHLNREAEAKSLLFGSEYREQKTLYAAGQIKLTSYLEAVADKLMSLHYKEAVRTSLVRVAIMLVLIGGWYWYIRSTKKWRKKINEVNQRRTEEAIAAAQQLKRANDQLHLLSAHLQEVRERERLGLANEINEELGQQIAALQIKIDAIQNNMLAVDKFQVSGLKEVSVQLGEALNSLRKLATDVYPLILRDLGLIEALKWESERMSNLIVTVEFFSEIDDLEVDQRTATQIYRSYQEKLQSLIRVGATEIKSDLRLKNGLLLLTIRDNAELAFEIGNKSMEDMIITERLRPIQGRSEIISSPKGGNSFTISIPYKVNQ